MVHTIVECYLDTIKQLKDRYPNIINYQNIKYITWYEIYWGVKNKWIINDITITFNHSISHKLNKDHYLTITWDNLSEPLYYLINSFECGDVLTNTHFPIKFIYNKQVYKFNKDKDYIILDVLNKNCNSLTIVYKNDNDLLWVSYCVPVIMPNADSVHTLEIDKYLQSDIYKRD